MVIVPIESKFDKFIGGGLLPKAITNFYGGPATGKTNFALMATVSASKLGKVIYVDNEAAFSIERLRQLARDDLYRVLENVILLEPTDYDEQKLAIRRIEELVSKNKISLIVVDSIGTLYRLEKERDIQELARQLSILLKISRTRDIPVLITNQVYTDIDSGNLVPVGGDVTRYWSKIILELKRENGTRLAIIRKHKFLPEGLNLRFKIIDTGIEVISYQIYDTSAPLLEEEKWK